MKAIVLSFDPHLEIANLVVESYKRLWPDCPLRFRIPFTERDPASIFHAENVEFVPTPSDIRSTMENLLRDLPEQEFVFWCIDDRFPIEIFNVAALWAVFDFVSGQPSNIDSIKLTDLTVEGVQGKIEKSKSIQFLKNFRRTRRSREDTNWRQQEEGTTRDPSFALGGQQFFRQLGHPKNGFYMPQFTTPAFLKRFFFASDLPAIYGIRDFHRFLLSGKFEHESYFPGKFLLSVGESTFGGKLSAACHAQMIRLGLTPPRIEIVNDYKIYSDREPAIVPSNV